MVGKKGGRRADLGGRRDTNSERSAVRMEGLRRERGRGMVVPRRKLMPPLSVEGDGGGVGAGPTKDWKTVR